MTRRDLGECVMRGSFNLWIRGGKLGFGFVFFYRIEITNVCVCVLLRLEGLGSCSEEANDQPAKTKDRPRFVASLTWGIPLGLL